MSKPGKSVRTPIVIDAEIVKNVDSENQTECGAKVDDVQRGLVPVSRGNCYPKHVDALGGPEGMHFTVTTTERIGASAMNRTVVRRYRVSANWRVGPVLIGETT